MVGGDVGASGRRGDEWKWKGWGGGKKVSRGDEGNQEGVPTFQMHFIQSIIKAGFDFKKKHVTGQNRRWEYYLPATQIDVQEIPFEAHLASKNKQTKQTYHLIHPDTFLYYLFL